jgi:hypothetical protein
VRTGTFDPLGGIGAGHMGKREWNELQKLKRFLSSTRWSCIDGKRFVQFERERAGSGFNDCRSEINHFQNHMIPSHLPRIFREITLSLRCESDVRE